jgi:hypothetical protein
MAMATRCGAPAPVTALRAAVRVAAESFDEAELVEIGLASELTRSVTEIRVRAIDELVRMMQPVSVGIAERSGRTADDRAGRGLAGAVIGAMISAIAPWKEGLTTSAEPSLLERIDDALSVSQVPIG